MKGNLDMYIGRETNVHHAHKSSVPLSVSPSTHGILYLFHNYAFQISHESRAFDKKCLAAGCEHQNAG